MTDDNPEELVMTGADTMNPSIEIRQDTTEGRYVFRVIADDGFATAGDSVAVIVDDLACLS